MKKKKKLIIPRPYKDVGDMLAAGREKAGLTQREVSIHLGYTSAQHISNFEVGIAAPPLNKLGRLIEMYKLSNRAIVEKLTACRREEILKALEAK